MTRLPVSALCLLTVCFWGTSAFAQNEGANDPPAHISVVDGAAILERDGRPESDLASMPLLAGDRIRTQGGRVEVLFADGSALHLDANTVVDFQSDEVVRLLEGRVRLSVANRSRELSYRVDAPSAWVQISAPGEYRIAILGDAEVELAVLRGSAELVNEQGRSYISAGERTFARGGAAPSPAYVFNSAAWDSFDRWSEARRDHRLGVSAQYLPDDVRPYAPAFDNHGSWRYEQTYGYVWYPRVQVGWRPYYHGRWASLRPYGWTWIARDPWGWPTHHYGRWGISAGAWFWIPGRSWSPAWVSWAYAPGYVSWSPLGWNNRPVFAINVNYYGGHRYDPWRAWTVVPHHHFNGSYINVSRYATVRTGPRFHEGFVVGHRAPAAHYAVGRSSVPIRTAGRYGVSRNDRSDDGFGPGNARTAGAGSVTGQGQRAFPSAARTPGTPLNPQVNRAGAPRAVSRDAVSPRVPSAAAAPARTPDAPPADRSTGAALTGSGFRSNDAGVRARRGDSAGGDVTTAPSGAVRAVPRVRSEAGGVQDQPSTFERTSRSRQAPPVPSSQPPSPAAPSQSAPSYRSAPAERRSGSPEAASPGGDRGYGRVRPDAPVRSPGSPGGGQPAYRAAPERQAPSAGADRAPRGSTDNARPGDGGGRERSSGSQSTGQATGRRR